MAILKFKQFRLEKIGGLSFRGQRADLLRQAYDSMDQETFAIVNGAQDWANRRQIPRAIAGRITRADALIIDLGCGPGDSTRIIARQTPSGCRIIGVDLSAELIARAKNRAQQGFFRAKDGSIVAPEFVCGDITGTLCGAAGEPLSSGSAHYVSSSGIVGHHLTPDDFARLAQELRRLIELGGHAALDCGPCLSASQISRAMEARGFILVKRARSVFFDPRPQLVFRRC